MALIECLNGKPDYDHVIFVFNGDESTTSTRTFRTVNFTDGFYDLQYNNFVNVSHEGYSFSQSARLQDMVITVPVSGTFYYTNIRHGAEHISGSSTNSIHLNAGDTFSFKLSEATPATGVTWTVSGAFVLD